MGKFSGGGPGHPSELGASPTWGPEPALVPRVHHGRPRPGARLPRTLNDGSLWSWTLGNDQAIFRVGRGKNSPSTGMIGGGLGLGLWAGHTLGSHWEVAWSAGPIAAMTRAVWGSQRWRAALPETGDPVKILPLGTKQGCVRSYTFRSASVATRSEPR